MLFGLPKNLVEKMQSLFANHPGISKVRIYGSRALGTYKAGSDIDLVIDGLTLNLTELLKIQTELDDLLSPYKMDVCLLQEIDNPSLLEHIERVGKDFYLKKENLG